MKNWKKVGVISIVIFFSIFLGVYFYGGYRASEALENKIGWDKYRVFRTPGGILEVAKLQKQESFPWQVAWVCPLNLCGFLPKGDSHISAVVYYTYRIPLSEYWVLERTSNEPLRYRLNVPKLQPQLPVTIDLSTIKIIDNHKIFAPAGPDRQNMQSHMQTQLEKNANSKEYIEATQNSAVKTIREFARKWMRDADQGRDSKIPEIAEIEVVFK